MREKEFRKTLFWLVFCAISLGMNIIGIIHHSERFIFFILFCFFALRIYQYSKRLMQLFKEPNKYE